MSRLVVDDTPTANRSLGSVPAYQRSRPPFSESPAWLVRVLLVLDKPMLQLVQRGGGLASNSGVYDTYAAASAAEAATALVTWRPHLILLEMELAGSTILEKIGRRDAGEMRLP